MGLSTWLLAPLRTSQAQLVSARVTLLMAVLGALKSALVVQGAITTGGLFSLQLVKATQQSVEIFWQVLALVPTEAWFSFRQATALFRTGGIFRFVVVAAKVPEKEDP